MIFFNEVNSLFVIV